jgi:hypothetical protein
MSVDAHKNFAYSTVATAPSPATSGTSLVVGAAEGARFPAVPFNATAGPIGVPLTPANSEIVRVTARATDTFTITRAQEGSSARTIVVGDQIFAAVTAKTLTDAEGMVRLYSAAGTDTSAAAANVDTFQLPTLTSKDRLWITWSLESITQATTGPVQIYSVTDLLKFTNLLAASAGVSAAAGFAGHMMLTPTQADLHRIQGQGANISYGAGTSANFADAAQTMTALWTAAPIIALRHGGVTAGGTLYWDWSIYLLAGQ